MADTHVPALHAALALALAARTGSIRVPSTAAGGSAPITLHQVDETRALAEALLPPGHPVRAAVLTFATMWEQHRRDPDQVRKQGEYLQDALARALNPSAAAPRMIYGGSDD